MFVYTGSQCLEHILGYTCILCLTKASYDKNLLFLKGFTCELMLIGPTANVRFQQSATSKHMRQIGIFLTMHDSWL